MKIGQIWLSNRALIDSPLGVVVGVGVVVVVVVVVVVAKNKIHSFNISINITSCCLSIKRVESCAYTSYMGFLINRCADVRSSIIKTSTFRQ